LNDEQFLLDGIVQLPRQTIAFLLAGGFPYSTFAR
jgi:hypothetical protein